MEEIIKHGSHDQKTHGGGGKGGGAGGLSPADNKKLDGLAVDMFNHKQNMPIDVRTGKKTPRAQAYRAEATRIIDTAATILDKSPQEAFTELNRRMGVGG
jgi:hypothetical protein